MISVQLPDGSKREFDGPVTVAEVAASIGSGLAKAALAGRVGRAPTRAWSTPATASNTTRRLRRHRKGCRRLDVIRHSTAHLAGLRVKSSSRKRRSHIARSSRTASSTTSRTSARSQPEDLAAIEAKMTELARQGACGSAGCCRAMRPFAHFRAWALTTGRDHRQHSGE